MSLTLEVLGFCVASPLGHGCSGYVVSDGETDVLLDCGPGVLERLWRRGGLGRLEAVVVSHRHQDHVLDLVPLANAVTQDAFAARGGRRLALHVPGPGGRAWLRRLAEVVAGDPDRFETAFDVYEHTASDCLVVEGLTFTFAEVDHPGGGLATRVTDGAASLVYGADGTASPSLERLARDADLLLAEATFQEPGELQERTGHATGEQTAALAARAGVGELVLTHLQPWVDGHDEEVRRRAATRFGGRVQLAREGLVVEARAAAVRR